jgi:hypothetical protein
MLQPWHQELSRDKNQDGPTLYRTVAASAPGLTEMHVTTLMWQTVTNAVDAVVARMGASGTLVGASLGAA